MGGIGYRDNGYARFPLSLLSPEGTQARYASLTIKDNAMQGKNFPNRLLARVSDAAEHYGAILGVGLTLLAGVMLYGYFSGNHDILMWAFWGTLAFVFGPPAIFMSSFCSPS